MVTQTELQELKSLISDRFNKIEHQTTEIKSELKELDKKFNDFDKELGIVKNDTSWIKWLFGFLLSAI